MTIIVPFRQRETHLAQFLPHMRAYLPHADIVVVEQEEGKPFNRGKLINIGFLETRAAFFVAHDVDILPIEVNYDPRSGVTQLASSKIQRSGYLGGVTKFDAVTFEKVGGYHNDYFHRAEDNELMFNLKRLDIPVVNRFGTFRELPHPRTGPEFIPELWEKAQRPRDIQDQLSVCQYEVISRREYGGPIHLIVSI